MGGRSGDSAGSLKSLGHARAAVKIQFCGHCWQVGLRPLAMATSSAIEWHLPVFCAGKLGTGLGTQLLAISEAV